MTKKNGRQKFLGVSWHFYLLKIPFFPERAAFEVVAPGGTCARYATGQGGNLKRDFCFMHTRAPPLKPQHRISEPVPSLKTHQQQVKGRSNGGICVGRRDETRIKSNGR